MPNGAHVHLHGTICRDIEIKSTPEGYQYGIIELAVEKLIGFSKEIKKPIYSSRRYKAYIWNKQIITKVLPTLKKGQQITLFGDLDLVPAGVHQKGVKAIITVTRPSGITVVPEKKKGEIAIEASYIEPELLTEEISA